MIREAVAGDEAALEVFLSKHLTTTMFMRGNLRQYGLGNRDTPYAMRYFAKWLGNEVIGVGAIANIGTLMAQADMCLDEIVAHMVAELPDHQPFGILGPPHIVKVLTVAFKTEACPTAMNHTEPLFLMGKSELKIPGMAGMVLRPSRMEDLPLMAKWNHAYNIEVLGGEDTAASREENCKQAVSSIERGHQRLLVKEGEVIAQTNFNATLPDAVQIGGVYTPPCRRGNGFARRAVALHLAEAFAEGVEHAILFSASEAASNVYRSIGFRQVGEYKIVLFE